MATVRNRTAAGEVVLVHSSDVHVDDDRSLRGGHVDGAAGLALVLASARALGADIVLLAGDTFDHSRVGSPALDRAARLLAEAGLPVVLLPGNHDPALPQSIFHRARLHELADVHVLGITHDEAVLFPEHDLEIWGLAHRDHMDMMPLTGSRPRRTRWQVAMAHGHYDAPPGWDVDPRPSYKITDAQIAASAVDYLALGHWERAMRVGDGRVPAYYSGSPDTAGTVNLVRLAAGGVEVTRTPL